MTVFKVEMLRTPYTPHLLEEAEWTSQIAGVIMETFVIVVSLAVIWWCIKDRFVWKAIDVISKPVVCVCRIDGRVGIVLQRDLQKSARKYWWKYRLGKKCWECNTLTSIDKRRSGNYIGHTIGVDPTFVLNDDIGSGGVLDSILERCYVEQAAFYVPFPSSRDTVAKELQEYLWC
jgi:hypothetical protein